MAKRSAKEWRERMRQHHSTRVEEITLPSGMVVEAKRPPLAEWIKRGQLPSGLMKMALDAFGDGKAGLSDPLETQRKMKAMQEGTMKIDPALVKDIKPGEFKELMAFMGHVVQQTVISPRIVVQVDGMIIKEEKDDDIRVVQEARGVATGRFVVAAGFAEWRETVASTAEGVKPVVRPIDEDEEIDAVEIDDQDTTFIFNYAMVGSKSEVVEMAGGEVTAAEAATFHPNDTLPDSGKGIPLLEGPPIQHIGG